MDHESQNAATARLADFLTVDFNRWGSVRESGRGTRDTPIIYPESNPYSGSGGIYKPGGGTLSGR
jgi:hypothetical protein